MFTKLDSICIVIKTNNTICIGLDEKISWFLIKKSINRNNLFLAY